MPLRKVEPRPSSSAMVSGETPRRMMSSWVNAGRALRTSVKRPTDRKGLSAAPLRACLVTSTSPLKVASASRRSVASKMEAESSTASAGLLSEASRCWNAAATIGASHSKWSAQTQVVSFSSMKAMVTLSRSSGLSQVMVQSWTRRLAASSMAWMLSAVRWMTASRGRLMLAVVELLTRESMAK